MAVQFFFSNSVIKATSSDYAANKQNKLLICYKVLVSQGVSLDSYVVSTCLKNVLVLISRKNNVLRILSKV